MTSYSTSSRSSKIRDGGYRPRPIVSRQSIASDYSRQNLSSHNKRPGVRLSDLTPEQQSRVLKARQEKQRIAKKGKYSLKVKVLFLIIPIILGAGFIAYIAWQHRNAPDNQNATPSSLAVDYDALYPGGVLSEEVASTEEYDQETKTLTYKDNIGSVTATVNQKPASDEHINNSDGLRKYLDDQGFKYQVLSGSSPEALLIDIENSSVQMVVFIKDEILIGITVDSKIGQQYWVNYISGLL